MKFSNFNVESRICNSILVLRWAFLHQIRGPHSRWINATRNELCILFGVFDLVCLYFSLICHAYSPIYFEKRKLQVQPIKDVISMRTLPSLNSHAAQRVFPLVLTPWYTAAFDLQRTFNACEHEKHINEACTFPRNRKLLMQISACDYVSRVALFTRGKCKLSKLFKGKAPCSHQLGFPRVNFRCKQLYFDSRHQACRTFGILFKAFTTW